MNTTTVEQSTLLPPPGTNVTVTAQDGYEATGRMLGLIRDVDGPKVRVMGRDRLERRVPMPVRVTVAG